MSTALNLLALIIAGTYFIGIGGALIFGMIDPQKDNTMDNRIVAVLLFLAFIVAPLIGVLSSL